MRKRRMTAMKRSILLLSSVLMLSACKKDADPTLPAEYTSATD